MPIKCYYEVLNIDRDADEDEIKKSYRKLALVWHPDKNPDRISEATENFRAIQTAYDVLSDPQERAWYDDHREAILRGGFKRGGDGSVDGDDDLDVYEYFSAACYSGFTDDDDGFFAVYREVFSKIAEEDEPFMDDEDHPAPNFGDSTSDFDTVGKFYDYWDTYLTFKCYSWKDKWDTRDAENRYVRRLMEQENKKLRETARKERNEEVRALVRFVKKRDPRVKARRKEMEERNAAAAKQQAERLQKQAQERLEMRADVLRQAKEESHHFPDDDALNAVEAQLADEFEAQCDVEEGSDAEVDMEEEEEDPLYCVACDKSSKTEKALINHIRTKKHIDKVQFVRSQLVDVQDDEDDEAVQKIIQRLNYLDKLAETADFGDNNDNSGKGGKKSKKKKGRKVDDSFSGDEECTPAKPAATSGSGDEGSKPAPVQAAAVAPEDEPQKRPKIKQRHPKPEKKVEEILHCVKCSEVFSSRNKLFQHLSETGHALPPSNVSQPKSGKKTKASKK